MTDFSVVIKNDDVYEGNEKFSLIINSSTLPPELVVGDPGTTVVTILDDECK